MGNREPWQWQEGDIEALLREQRTEDLQLEYKRSDALAKTDGKKTEISKDVSAMANSAGGTIIYGIDQQGPNGALQLDSGIDPQNISKEWLEQVIDSGIQRRIDGLSIRPVKMSKTGTLVYVVWIPQSNRAPHMAADHRYYKRLITTTAMMEKYEVRDVGRRLESPDLDLALKLGYTGPHITIRISISNRSPEPAFHAMCRLYLEDTLTLKLYSNRWTELGDTNLIWNDTQFTFHTVRCPWSIPECHPILEGEEYPMEPLGVDIGVDLTARREVKRFHIGWEIRVPKAPPKLRGLMLTVDHSGPQLEKYFYTLARPNP